MLLGASVPVLKSDGSTTVIPVASETTVYTRAFKLSLAQFFGIWVRASSVTGTPSIKIELEESYYLPTTEGSAETALWGEPDGMDDIFSSITDESVHMKTLSPVPMAFGRYKITGLGSPLNPADTVVHIENFMQEDAR